MYSASRFRGLVASPAVRQLWVNSNTVTSQFARTSVLSLGNQERCFSSSFNPRSSGSTGSAGADGSRNGIIAGVLAGCAAAVGVSLLQKKPKVEQEVVPHSPTTPLAGIVAETSGIIAEHQKVVPVEAMKVINDEKEFLAYAPNVPPPITRRTPARLIINMTSTAKLSKLSPTEDYEFWTFSDAVPGPMIRCRVGDVMEVHFKNLDHNGIGHNVDFHAATGPGGGAAVTYAEQNEVKTAWFKMLQPGLYVYHCAAAPVPVHVAHGMYGLVMVEPEDGMPPVDKEYYVMQSEFYTEPGGPEDGRQVQFSYQRGLDENPSHVVFNGRVGALTEAPLTAKQGDRVRLYVGNGGPNLVSSFHVIGTIFDRVYREGDMTCAPARGLQTTIIPAGGSAVVEFDAIVPGNFTIVDHSIFRIEKGAIGFIKVLGSDPRKDVYSSLAFPNPCPNCKLHT